MRECFSERGAGFCGCGRRTCERGVGIRLLRIVFSPGMNGGLRRGFPLGVGLEIFDNFHQALRAKKYLSRGAKSSGLFLTKKRRGDLRAILVILQAAMGRGAKRRLDLRAQRRYPRTLQ